MTPADVERIVLELLERLLVIAGSVDIGGTDSGSWTDRAVDAEALLTAVQKNLRELPK